MRGQKPKPIPLRLIEGNREHRTIHPELVPKPRSGRPPNPKILSADGRKHWKYLLRQLASMNCLAESDQATVMSAALAYQQVLDVQREIAAAMQAELDAKGRKELFGLRRLLNNTASNLVKFEAELGLNPTARSRVKLDRPHTQSRREKLLG